MAGVIRALAVALLLVLAAGQEEEGTSSPQLAIIIKDASLRIEESDGTVAKDVALSPPATLPDKLRLDHTQTLKVWGKSGHCGGGGAGASCPSRCPHSGQG